MADQSTATANRANIDSFFHENFSTPTWLKNKVSRRSALKSAAGASMIAAMPMRSWSAMKNNELVKVLKTDPWLTLDLVLTHLLPESPTGPSAKELHATQYLYNVVFHQPTDSDEIEFIYKGVGWLNGFSQSQLQKNFVALTFDEKETLLRAISNSTAGENWLSNLVGYLFEAMLSPPSYGGNPDGIGWQWLEHQAGFPLPKEGQRYYELPGKQPIIFRQNTALNINTRKQVGTKKA